MARSYIPFTDFAGETTGFVYALLCEVGETPLVKIGTTLYPKTRIRALETQSPVPVKTLGTVEGGRRLERALHIVLDDYRSHGEWFRYEGDVVEAAEIIANKSGADAEQFVLSRWPGLQTYEESIAYIESDDFGAAPAGSRIAPGL